MYGCIIEFVQLYNINGESNQLQNILYLNSNFIYWKISSRNKAKTQYVSMIFKLHSRQINIKTALSMVILTLPNVQNQMLSLNIGSIQSQLQSFLNQEKKQKGNVWHFILKSEFERQTGVVEDHQKISYYGSNLIFHLNIFNSRSLAVQEMFRCSINFLLQMLKILLS